MTDRPWISVADQLPEVGQRVEVWMLSNRLAMEDENGFGKWEAAYGEYATRGRFTVNGDHHAIVSAWRVADEGPEEGNILGGDPQKEQG